MRLRRPVLLALLGVAVSGCADVPHAEAGHAPSGTTGSHGSASAGPSRARVLFDEPWLVEEGVWFIAGDEVFPGHPERATRGQRNGLLGAGDPEGLWVQSPALYGKFRVRVELRGSEPPVAAWCRDVVEVSYRVGRQPLQLGSFETFSDPMRVPAGSYRVRYCVSGLDRAARETEDDEFDGDDYRLYSGRHLFQLWPAPAAPDRVIRQGSRFAASVVPRR